MNYNKLSYGYIDKHIKPVIKEIFINVDELKWKRVSASQWKEISIHNGIIYKKCKPKKNQLLINEFVWDFKPNFTYDSSNNIISEEFYDTPLTKYNKPVDFVQQLLSIEYVLKKNNVYHNDIKESHFFVKDNKIKLIDWNNATFDKPYKPSIFESNWMNNDFNKIINKLSQK